MFSYSIKRFAASTLFVLFFVVLFFASCALANDTDLLWELPGTWTYSIETEEGRSSPAVLTLNHDGSMNLFRRGESGQYEYFCGGIWSIEIIEPSEEHGYNDRLTLLFSTVDTPVYTGSAYSGKCVYYVYAESWIKESTRFTYLIDTEPDCSGISPFEELCSEEGAGALHKEEGPNMQVTNCKKNVSLRESPSKESACLVKVPLGTKVFAFPEEAVKEGFLRCVYGDHYGYILENYLKPVENQTNFIN